LLIVPRARGLALGYTPSPASGLPHRLLLRLTRGRDSYLIGKQQIEMLLAARKKQLGDSFRMRQFMDSFNAAGLVPASLLRWELTGELPEDVRRMLASQ